MCGVKLPASSVPRASPFSGLRGEMPLLRSSGGELSTIWVSAAGRHDGEQVCHFPRTQDVVTHGPVMPQVS